MHKNPMRYIQFIILLFLLAGCIFRGNLKPQDVIDSFEAAGLEVGDYRSLVEADYEYLPFPPDDGIRFIIPSLAESQQLNSIMYFEDEERLKKVKDFYEELGVLANDDRFVTGLFVRDHILVHMYVQLDESTVAQYEAAFQSIGND